MRARNIKPGFFRDAELVECSFPSRLLAIGLWGMADREGRLMDKPKQIKMEIFPADSVDIEELLSELHTHQHIIRYEIDSVQYIQIRKFTDHQSPHFTEKDSLIPAPLPEHFQKNISSSPIIPKALLPDSLIPECSSTEEYLPRKKVKVYPEDFESIWKAYPSNGASKAEALKSYQKAVSGGISSREIFAAIEPYRLHLKATETTVAHLTTWLNQQRWTVDYAKLNKASYEKPTEIRENVKVIGGMQ